MPLQLVQPKLFPKSREKPQSKEKELQKSRSINVFRALIQFLRMQRSFKRKSKHQNLVAKRHRHHKPWEKPSTADEGKQSRKNREGGRG